MLHIERTGLAERTIGEYSAQVRRFTTWLAAQANHNPVEAFTDPWSRDFALRDYRSHLLDRGLAASSVDAALAAASSFYSWIGLGPSTDVRRVSTRGNQFGEHLDAGQTQAVMRAAERRGRRDLAIIGTMAFAGLRLAEVGRLNIDDWWASDRKGQMVVHGKGAKVRKVDLGPHLRRVLTDWRHERAGMGLPGDNVALFVTTNGARVATRTIDYVVREVGKAAGIPSLHPHQLRHTFARAQVDSGIPLPDVQTKLGHSSLSTTQLYVQPSKEQLEASAGASEVNW